MSEVLDEVGVSEKQLEQALDNGDFELFYKIDEFFQNNPSIKEEAASHLIQHYPHEAPSWAHLSLNVKRLLPPDTWLVHWCKDAVSIAREGFTRGVMDVANLGLTTYRSDKQFGGYNFAFHVSDAENPDRKYGDECVIFQSSGVECYHEGDDEDQVIFWGKDITTRPVAIVEGSDGWEVLGKNAETLVRLREPTDCFDWVIKHRDRYRKPLGL